MSSENSFAIVGTPRFPDVCPNCNNPANARLTVERSFHQRVSDGDGYTDEYPVYAYYVPFCAACVHKHQAEQKPLNPWIPLKRVFSSGEGFGGVIVGFVALFFAKEALVRFSWIPLLIGAIPALTAWFLVRKVWRETRHMAVYPATSVSSAVEFSAPMAQAYEPDWRTFQFRNPFYARLFHQLNADRLWDPQGEVARQAREKRKRSDSRTKWVIATVVVAVLCWGLWDDYVRPHWPVIREFLNLR